MDLSNIQMDEAAEVEILDPVTHEPTDVVITIFGQDSEVYRRVARAQQNRRLEKLMKAGRTRRVERAAEDAERDAVELLAACTKGWRGIEEDGQPLPCNEENARRVYQRAHWIREQVDAAVVDRSLFFRTPASSSSSSPAGSSA